MGRDRWNLRTLLLLVALLATACASDDLTAGPRGGLFPDLLDPTETDETRPDNYRESLPRDAINPIYDPVFVRADEVRWRGDDLVIGVNLEGEARAYPVDPLTWREIVIDDHRGIPTMVTW